MAASIALDQPFIFVAELENLFTSSVRERQSLSPVVEVAAVLAGDVESLGFVDGGECGQVFDQHEIFTRGEELDWRGGEVELDSIVKIDSGQRCRCSADILDLDEFEIISAVRTRILWTGRMVHELGDSQGQVRIVDEGRLGQAAPVVAKPGPGLDPRGRGQNDRLALVGRAGAEDRYDQQIAGIDCEVESLDGEDVRSLPQSLDSGVGDAEGFELQGCGVVVLG